MTIKIEIIKTSIGWNYRNSESRRLVGTVNKHARRSDTYIWETYNDCGSSNESGAQTELRAKLTAKASELGVEIEFINI